jgi:O-antigen/teichoic acid export membrane protein
LYLPLCITFKNLKKEFLINIILLLVINLLIKPIYIFLIEAKVQNVVGIEVYGAYFSYLNFVFLFQFINDPGLQNWNAQYVPKNKETIGFHFTQLLYTKSILAVLFIGIVLFMSHFMGYADTTLLYLLAANLILSSLFMLFRTTLSGMGYYRLDSWLSALDKILMITILGYVLYVSPLKSIDIHQFAALQCVAYLIAVIFTFLIILVKIKVKVSFFSLLYFVKITRQCLPYILTLLFMTAYNKLDGVMLSKMLNDNHFQAGVYASAYRIYDAANMTGYLFAALLLPMYASNVFNKKVLEDLMNIGIKYVSLMSFMIVCIVFYYGEPILQLIYNDYHVDFFTTLKWLILSYMMVAIAYIYGSLLVASGKINRLNVVFGIGLIINIILNLIFIPRYHASGAAFATFITQISVLGGQYYLTKREINIKSDIKIYTQLIQFIFLSNFIFYVVKSVINIDWIFNLALSILICLLLSFILKIVDFKDGMALVENRKSSK